MDKVYDEDSRDATKQLESESRDVIKELREQVKKAEQEKVEREHALRREKNLGAVALSFFIASALTNVLLGWWFNSNTRAHYALAEGKKQGIEIGFQQGRKDLAERLFGSRTVMEPDGVSMTVHFAPYKIACNGPTTLDGFRMFLSRDAQEAVSEARALVSTTVWHVETHENAVEYGHRSAPLKLEGGESWAKKASP